MNKQTTFTIGAMLVLGFTLTACQAEEEHGHSHDGQAPATVAISTPTKAAGAQPEAKPANDAGIRSDEVRVVLKPNQGTEVKMVMSKGQKVDYSWQSVGGPVNHDTHGESLTAGSPAHRYSKGVQVPNDSGTLVAAFDGEHGWFWRNRNDRDVTITLKVNGQYASIKQKK